ncbi:MAG TPA: cytochrome c biogenesis protein CcsA, partial [Chthoniobacterales bacterium]
MKLSAGVDYTALDALPVQHEGRRKPFLAFAQENILLLSGKTAVAAEGRKLAAGELVTRLWLEPEKWLDHPVILVDYLPLKEAAGLAPDRKWFSYTELMANPGLQAFFANAAVPGRKLEGLPKKAEEVHRRLRTFEALVNGSLYRVAPLPAGNDWVALPAHQPEYAALRNAHESENAAEYLHAAQTLQHLLGALAPEKQPPAWKIGLEVFYQKLHPFRWAWIFYAASAILLAVTWKYGRAPGYRIAWALVLAGFAFQVFGFVSRILIAGRPPVTNMYESVIWVSFGAMAFALIFEAIYRSRFFILGAVPVTVFALILADSQPAALNPAISPLVAVLQSNFWLTTHVLTITLGYAAFALALGVAHLALGQVIFGRKLSPELADYVYRAMQVGVLLLATGTVLGAVWANYSWGRFWDWDPKETWALVALLVYLFILHGRLAGRWAGFGLAVGAVLAFQSVIMAWYGVNFVLGVGLHSYG